MKKAAPIVLLATALPIPSLADTITFKYSEPHEIQKSNVEVGDPINVVVTGACEEFALEYQGYKPITNKRPKPEAGVLSKCADDVFNQFCIGGEPISETIEHSGRYEGYEIRVVTPPGVTRMVTRTDVDKGFDMETFCQDTGIPDLKKTSEEKRKAAESDPSKQDEYDTAKQKLDVARAKLLSQLGSYGTDYEITQVQNPKYLVVVENSRWQTDFSVGPAVSRLTSPVYYVDEANTIRRNHSAENEVELILAGFAHVWNRDCNLDFSLGIAKDGWNWDCSRFALTGGVGTSSASTIDYFMGLSRRYGPAMLTAGAHWGSVGRLPAGYAVDETTDDASIVSESRMEERTDVAFFLSLTYTFGDGADQDAFSKKIARIGN